MALEGMNVAVLKTIAPVVRNDYEARLFKETDTHWKIELTITQADGTKKTDLVVTHRGTPKTYRVFEDAIDFVVTNFPDLKSLVISYANFHGRIVKPD